MSEDFLDFIVEPKPKTEADILRELNAKRARGIQAIECILNGIRGSEWEEQVAALPAATTKLAMADNQEALEAAVSDLERIAGFIK